MRYLKPQQPDPYIKTEADMTPAKFGHLRHLVNAITALEEADAAQVGVAVADATDEASAVVQLNALLASLRDAGIIAS